MPRSNFVRARKMFKKIGGFRHFRKFVPRNPILLALEGKYSISDYRGEDFVMYDFVREHFPNGVISKYLPDGRRLSQFLIRLKKFDESRVAKFIENIQAKDYYITCRATDIARMSLSKHYSSCRNLKKGDYNDQCLGFMYDEDMAMIVVKDRGGDFLGRQILRYTGMVDVWEPDNCRYNHVDKRVISIHKAYGNIVPRASLAAVTMALSRNPNLKVTVEDQRHADG